MQNFVYRQKSVSMKHLEVLFYAFFVVLGLTIASPAFKNTSDTTEIPYRRFNFTRRRVKFPILPPKLRTTSTTTPRPSADLLVKRIGLSDESSTNMSVMVAAIPNSLTGSEIASAESVRITDTLNVTSNSNGTHGCKKSRKLNRRRGFGSVIKLMKQASSQNVVVLWTNRNGLPRTMQKDAKITTPERTRDGTFATISPPISSTTSEDGVTAHLVWPVPRKLVSRRIWTTNIGTTPSTPLPKLLLPKPTRPAIYSLDGFIPTPSMAHITTTPPPKREIRLLTSASRRREVIAPSKYQKKNTRRFSIIMRRKGVPGKDYPVYTHVPSTRFRCGHKSGMFADRQTGCQAWHMCPGGGKPHRYSFLCPHGTIFSQKRGICDWWYKVDCGAEVF